MSLGIVVKGPSGLVVAADSRVTLTAQGPGAPAFPVTFDNASKLLTFGANHIFVAATTYGQAVIPAQERTAASYLPELQASLPANRLTVGEYASTISDFFMAQWGAAAVGYQGVPMLFQVAGFDAGQPYGRVFQFALPQAPLPVELFTLAPGFGTSWGGQTEIVDRIYNGYQIGLADRIAQLAGFDAAQTALVQQALNAEGWPIPIGVMALQDCVNLAETLIRTTIAMQQLAYVLRGVGGAIDIVTITRTEGVQSIRMKGISLDE